MILLISHYNFNPADPKPIHGPVHSIASYLEKRKIDHKILLLPLYTGPKAVIITFKEAKATEKKLKLNLNHVLPIRSILEFCLILKVGFKTKPEIIIAVDPLNAFAGILLKKFGITKKLVFYTVDYADDRFSNSLVNSLYHFLDRIACSSSDYVWNVSSRILKQRIKMGIPKDKLVLLPNSPDSNAVKPGPTKLKHENWILLVSGTTHSNTFDISFNAFLRTVKKFPKAKMIIVSGDVLKSDLEKKIKKLGITDNIKMIGPQSHDKLIELMRKCGIGLSLYTSDYSWTEYGDSMKAREYLATGMPVIITDNVSTSDDITKYKAGYAVKLNIREISSAMTKLLSNKILHKKMSQNAREIAIQNDFASTLKSLLDLLSV